MAQKVKKLARKDHSNIYEAVTFLKSEQAATVVSLIQLAPQKGFQKGGEKVLESWE